MSTLSYQPPDPFLEKMQSLLSPEEYGQFIASYDETPHFGLRVNTLKLTAADFSTLAPFPLTPVGDYETAAFAVASEDRPGRHPYHDAGLYYLQEPSAMVAAALLNPLPGEWVLDIAAAPGGKATHLSSLLNSDAWAGEGSVLRRTAESEGLLVANDIVRNRAAILAGNLARWGATNQLVTAEVPERLAAHFGPVFDRVLVDAPCSGEGMFRRQGDIEWSERMVLACAIRQSHLLETAARTVRLGGRLLYATCTFSPEENEAVIGRFLSGHSDFEVIEPPRHEGFGRGRPEWAGSDGSDETLRHTVRLWPHVFRGEGHFLALLQRHGHVAQPHDAGLPTFAIRNPARNEMAQWHAFAGESLNLTLPENRLHAAGGKLYLIPTSHPDSSRLHLVRYGIMLGELRSGYFRPSADLALSLNAADALNAASWAADDARLLDYLSGQDIDDAGPDGWVLVCANGYGLGWAKRVNGRLKNHYPRGKRRPSPHT